MAEINFDPALLGAYGQAAEKFNNANTQLEEAKKSIEPAQSAYDEAKKELEAAVEALGTDPFSLLKGAKGSGSRGPRGPRDPEKRNRVLEALTGRTVADVVDAVNAEYGADYVDKGYVNGVINSQRTKNADSISSDGERGSKTYTYVAQAASTPVEA